jgi:hypothetical protein
LQADNAMAFIAIAETSFNVFLSTGVTRTGN